MRLRLDLHISLGKEDPPAEEQRDSDSTGYAMDAGDTDTGLGFKEPGPKLDEAWEGRSV